MKQKSINVRLVHVTNAQWEVFKALASRQGTSANGLVNKLILDEIERGTKKVKP